MTLISTSRSNPTSNKIPHAEGLVFRAIEPSTASKNRITKLEKLLQQDKQNK